MPRKTHLFKELGQRRCLLRVSVQPLQLQHLVCLRVAVVVRVSMRGLKPTYVLSFLKQALLFLTMRISTRPFGRVS